MQSIPGNEHSVHRRNKADIRGIRKWPSQPNVVDIVMAQDDNRFLVTLTNVRGHWSLSLMLRDLGARVMPDVADSAPCRLESSVSQSCFAGRRTP